MPVIKGQSRVKEDALIKILIKTDSCFKMNIYSRIRLNKKSDNNDNWLKTGYTRKKTIA